MTNISMTPKQQRFVAEYLQDLNATQAAIRAGYSKSGASVEGVRLLANAKVAAAVAAAVAERSERTEVTQDYVLNSIVETIERCKQAEPVKYQNGEPVFIDTPDGDVAPAYKFNATAILNRCGHDSFGHGVEVEDLVGRRLAHSEVDPIEAVIESNEVVKPGADVGVHDGRCR